MTHQQLWERFKKYYYWNESLELGLDISRMNFPDNFFSEMDASIRSAFGRMDALEAGEIANPDEGRMVGHYWLRESSLAPTEAIRQEINEALEQIHDFARRVHTGTVKGERGRPFKNLLVVGIGGSALGPQFVSRALGSAADRMRPYFFDNTDPDGMDKALAEIGDGLDRTLSIVISKSGGTPETRNGMVEAKTAYEQAGLGFGKHAVAITMQGSKLGALADSGGWLERFPLWDWVGGRTSELAAVGLLPAALQGLDIDGMLEGARAMDAATRVRDPLKNPAALLALMWYYAGNGKGEKDMVLLPYKDRLELFSKYLQQLVMESLGKERDLDGIVVHQGIAVYGNKGSTDQHAYVQQLREGVNNFFVTFIEVLKDREGPSVEVEPGATAGDFLSGLFQGTRSALYENGRESISLTVGQVNSRAVGRLIALYERAVGFYASLVNINAYHQPGVEAGKKAAAGILELQGRIIDGLSEHPGQGRTAEEIASAMGRAEAVEPVFKILQHLSANPDHDIQQEPGPTPFDARYSRKEISQESCQGKS